MREESYMHPLTEHLLKTRGMATKGWIRFNGLNVNSAANTIYNGYFDQSTVKKLREDGLYEYLTEKVRQKIEEAEKAKGNTNGQ